MKPYTLALAANTPMPVHSGGEYFLLESAPLGGVRVEFFGAAGVRRDQLIEDGEESTYAHIREGFTSLKLTSTLAQTVKFYLARDGMGRNVFSGSSDVTDRAARLLGSLAPWRGHNREGSPGFMAFGNVGAVAGQAGSVQLWNPAGSGKTGLLDSFGLRVGAATGGVISFHNAALANLAAATSPNKLLGGAASALQIRTAAAAVIPGSLAWVWQQLAAAGYWRDLREPITIPEGFGVLVTCQTVNTAQDSAFEWREV
jgi:hypothetical protein